MAKNYKFLIVHFVEEDGIFDFVPKDWLECHPSRNDVMICPFVGSNPTSSDLKQLKKLVKNCSPAPKTWKKYVVDIRGYTNTFHGAEEALLSLKKEPYGFSTMDDSDPEERIEEIKKLCKEKYVMTKKKDTKNLFDEAKCQLTAVENEKKNKKRNIRKIATTDKNSVQVNSGSSDSDAVSSSESNSTSSVVLKKKQNERKEYSSSDDEIQKKEESRKKKGREVFLPENEIPKKKISGKQKDKKMSMQGSGNHSPSSVPTEIDSSSEVEKNFLSERSSDACKRSLSTPARRTECDMEQRDDTGYLEELNHRFRQQILISKQVQSYIVSLRENIERLEHKVDVLLERNNQTADGDSESLRNFLCKTIENINEFDARLKSEPDFRQTIIGCIRRLINRNLPLQRMIGLILKDIMTRDLFEKFVPQKAAQNKQIFKNLELWRCIMKAINSDFHDAKLDTIKDHEFLAALSAAFNNNKTKNKNQQTETGTVG